MKILVLLLTFLSLSGTKLEPVKIDWKTLADVDFDKKWNKETGNFDIIANFGPKVLPLDGKEIIISGFMIPVDIDAEFYVLSSNPYTSCFFCGQAGPESVASVKFLKKGKRYNTDDRLTIKGILRLNKDDINELNYIIEDAVAI